MILKRERILAAITTALAGTVQVGSRIYRSREEAFARNEAPALVIEPGIDTPTVEPVSTCKIDWRFNVVVAVHTRGAIPDQLAAPIVVSVHLRIMADRSLGGLALDVLPGPVDHQREQADAAAGWTVLSYVVRYRTSIEDLSV